MLDLTTTANLNVGGKNSLKFMRRLAIICGLLLALSAGVWGGAFAAVASACCLSAAAGETAPASDEHDCCRAKIGESNASHTESTGHAHAGTAATREDELAPEPQADGSHAGLDCEAAAASGGGANAVEAKAVCFAERGHSCLECCAGRGKQMPTTATVSAPEPNKVKRGGAHASSGTHRSFAHGAQDVAHLSPSQHAPPAPGERRHKLINVFLI